MATNHFDDHEAEGDPGVRMPQSREAEDVVLDCLVMEPGVLDRIRFLAADDFLSTAYRTIFTAALALDGRGEPVEHVTLFDELTRTNKLADAGGVERIYALGNGMPTTAYLEHYARIVKRTSLLRQAIEGSGTIAGSAFAQDDPEQVVETIERIGSELRRQLLGGRMADLSITADLDSFLEHLEARSKGEMPTGVLTGYTRLDELTGGLQNTNLIVVAARPGGGKTSLMLSMAYQQAKRGIPVGIFSAEMAREELMQRLVSIDSSVPLQAIREGKLSEAHWDAVSSAVAHLHTLTFAIDDTPNIAISTLRSQARRMIREQHIQALYVDYLQLLAPSPSGDGRRRAENRTQEVGEMAKSLKQLARETHLPVVVLAQLSREVERRADKKPVLSDLRESGDIENAADVVILISRDTKDEGNKHVAELDVAKHRNGPKGSVSLFFQADQTYYRNLTTLDWQ